MASETGTLNQLPPIYSGTKDMSSIGFLPPKKTGKVRSSAELVAIFLFILSIILVGCEANRNAVLDKCVTHEEGGIHFHVSLVTVHNRQPQMLPAGIGITHDCMKPLHTHSEDFIIHVEYDEQYKFAMGDFFEVWGEKHPYVNSEVVSISLNGKRYDGNYRKLILEDGQNIVIEFEN